MSWLMIFGVGMIWAAFALPQGRRKTSVRATIEDFERGLGLLAETERSGGRWIVAPRKGERFLGHHRRARTRARERRRRVFVFLLESIGLTFLIGLFPPLRGMWVLTAALVLVLGVYCFLLIRMKHLELDRPGRPAHQARHAAPPTWRARPNTAIPAEAVVAAEPAIAAEPVVILPESSQPRALMVPGRAVDLGEGDLVHVVVRSASELEAARA